jgi:hypothetical protein
LPSEFGARPKDRWRADNRAISVTGFRDKLEALANGKRSALLLAQQ